MPVESKVRLRKCVGCNEMKDQKDLIRLVKYSDGTLEIDPDHKKNGRGAYVCRNRSCIENAEKRKSFERSLKCRIDSKLYEDLLKECEG